MPPFTHVTRRLVSVLASGGDRALSAYNFVQAGICRPGVADLRYGEHPRQALDLYLPRADALPAPLLVWFYGGSWNSGNKAKYAFVARRFTALGYAVAIPDYRLVPHVRFPAFIHDGAMALSTLAGYARAHPQLLASRPMVLAGHSAGAYNAVQLAADPRYLERVGMSRADVGGIIGLSGPYDFHPYDPGVARETFGDVPACLSQPVAQDLSAMPPLLLLTGDRDTTVGPHNSERLAKVAPKVELRVIDGLGHVDTLLALGSYLTTNEAVTAPVTAFLEALAAGERAGPAGSLSGSWA
jgi:acetyl esterase/lipase